MSNPTSNFGWVMPTNSDLVTDLPADFAVFGQAVDTSMADLLGGTTGQILSKASGTNMDFTWIANDQGDITGVTASTGLTGGGTSGTVSLAIDSTVATLTGSQTLTNKTLTTPIISSISNTGTLTLPTSTDTLVGRATTDTLTNKTLTSPVLTTPTISTLTTNGDLLYGTGSGALSRLGIGSTSQVLTVTGGVPVWAAAGGGAAFVGCSVYKSASQSLTNEVVTAITWDSEDYDTDAIHSTSSNTSRFTVPSGKTGYWLFAGVVMYATGTGDYRGIRIYKNGGIESYQYYKQATNATAAYGFSYVWKLTAADYLEIYGDQSSGGALDLRGTTTYSRATFTYLGA
jgi:hypothetical protein